MNNAVLISVLSVSANVRESFYAHIKFILPVSLQFQTLAEELLTGLLHIGNATDTTWRKGLDVPILSI